MLQRIQTIYLLLIAILSSLTLILPLSILNNSTNSVGYILKATGLFSYQGVESILQSNVWGILIIGLIIPVMALITIFLYKKRKIQLSLLYIIILLLILFCITVYIYINSIAGRMNLEYSLIYTDLFPIVNMIFSLLAIAGIKKDEKLVKSLDRLR